MHAESLACSDFIEFYREIVHDEGRIDFAPMLDLVRQLQRKPYAHEIPGGTSLERLVLGADGADSIVVHFSQSKGTFDVTYFDSRTQRHTKTHAFPDGIDSLIDAVIQRLLFNLE